MYKLALFAAFRAAATRGEEKKERDALRVQRGNRSRERARAREKMLQSLRQRCFVRHTVKRQKRNTTVMHVHVGRKKRHAVQPSVRCCLPANGTSPKYSSTLSVDMLLSDRDTLDSEPLDASSDPPVGNCRRSSSVSVSMSRDLRLYTCERTNTTLGKGAARFLNRVTAITPREHTIYVYAV